MSTLYLASASPRRAELLAQIAMPFSVRVRPVDETPRVGESPEAYVARLAQDKARAALAGLSEPEACTLGADTAVVLGAEILGKPRDADDARRMLAGLSGRDHRVLTAVAVADATRCVVEVVATRVWFRALTPAEIDAYWASGEPRDKAGAYGIQGLGAVFVERIEGSYSAVVGLPLCETARLLDSFGHRAWRPGP